MRWNRTFAACALMAVLAVSLLTACSGSEAPDGPADSEKPGSSTSQGSGENTGNGDNENGGEIGGSIGEIIVDNLGNMTTTQEIPAQNSRAYQTLHGMMDGGSYYINYDYYVRVLLAGDGRVLQAYAGSGNVEATSNGIKGGKMYGKEVIEGRTNAEKLMVYQSEDQNDYYCTSYWINRELKQIVESPAKWNNYPKSIYRRFALTTAASESVNVGEGYILPTENSYLVGTCTVNNVTYYAEKTRFFDDMGVAKAYCFEGNTLKYIIIHTSESKMSSNLREIVIRVNTLQNTPKQNLLQLPEGYPIYNAMD